MIPAYIKRTLSEKSSYLHESTIKNFIEIELREKHVYETIINAPSEVKLGYLTSCSPEEVASISGNRPFEFLIFNYYENIYFNAFLQIKRLTRNFSENLEERDYYSSAIILRAWLEVVISAYYPLIKSEKLIGECIQILNSLAKTKSEHEQLRLNKRYAEITYQIFSNGFDFFHSCSADFNHNLLAKFKVDTSAFPKTKKIHINDTITVIEKESKLPIKSIYSLLSDFCHPNSGSRMLMMETLEDGVGILQEAILSSQPNSEEASLFYLDTFSEAILLNLNLSLTLPERYKRFLDFWFELVDHKKQ